MKAYLTEDMNKMHKIRTLISKRWILVMELTSANLYRRIVNDKITIMLHKFTILLFFGIITKCSPWKIDRELKLQLIPTKVYFIKFMF